MKIAFSPCPNDTYLFYAWIKGLVGQELAPHPILADIQQLNAWGMKKTFPLTKLSLHCFAKVVYTYQLLPIGFALGFNCGPKIIAKIPFHLSELSNKTIAIPGKETTAHLLLSRLSVQPKKKLFCLYHEINTQIEKGEADCGVIIHESRFTFQEAGFVEIVDLGEVWHAQTHLPLPLGGIAMMRDVPDTIKRQIVNILRDSLAYAHSQPISTHPFILQHSQEKDPTVIQKHINTYINSETEQLSTNGMRAIETLLGFDFSKDWLYE